MSYFESHEQRRQWMLNEAERLIKARAQVQRPAQPVQFEAPTNPADREAEAFRLDAINELGQRLARKDKGLL